VSGPIGIAGVGQSAVKEGFGAAAMVAALISINLALINLLPIPGLDGGRLLIIIIEAVIRRPVSARVTNALMLAGFAAIVLLMIAVSVHDIARLVG
jgi:regulator of sigma E protease